MRRSPPTRVMAAAVIATTVFAQLVLLALAAVGFGFWAWARYGPDVLVLVLFFGALLLGIPGAMGLWISVAALRRRPNQLVELQMLLWASVLLSGLAAVVTLAIVGWMMLKMKWREVLDEAATPQAAGLVLLWLNAAALWAASALLRNQNDSYAEW